LSVRKHKWINGSNQVPLKGAAIQGKLQIGSQPKEIKKGDKNGDDRMKVRVSKLSKNGKLIYLGI
jgi:hypothetical protein